MLESAIPKHLQQERTRPSSLPDEYEPPFPAYCARFPENAKDLVMGIFGAQFGPGTAGNEDSTVVTKALSTLTSFTSAELTSAPSFSEAAAVTDAKGFYDIAVLAYWPSKELYTHWSVTSGFQKWWEELNPEAQQHGWFRETFFPPIERFETVFSNNEVPEGAAHMREKVSGQISEHVYWGSMRDRLPISQTDDLVGEQTEIRAGNTNDKANTSSKKRISVPGLKNLCIIRSGQDWRDTYPEERELYLKTMHPVLTRGMDFLRDNGKETGCFSCRFMDVVDTKTAKADKDRTFGLAYFDDIASLERWSKEHKTHLDIFGGFLQYAKKLENNISLRLFHEVLVLEPDQQHCEYIGCHAQTGMLVGLP